MNAGPQGHAERDHFARIAPQWSQFGPPLRPTSEDTAFMQRIVSHRQERLDAVVLGVTPEIVGCTWPAGTRLTAVDHSSKMIAALWPPKQTAEDAAAVLGDWCAMPLASASVDLVAGDGCFIVLPYPQGYDSLLREVRRVLRPGGRLAIRVFLRPDAGESVDDIARDLALGNIGSVHVLKLRLLAALHGASGAGTLLDDVSHHWHTMRHVVKPTQTRGWSAEEIVSIENYRGMSARYYLPTLNEFRACLHGFFVESACDIGGYEIADRCPTLTLCCAGSTQVATSR